MTRRLPERRNRYDQPNEKRRPRRGDEDRGPGYNLANASSLASVLSEVLDKELGSTIEGQSFAAPITLLDKLKEDGKGLERRAVRAASRHARQSRSRIMPLAVLCLLGGISGMIGGVADGYEHGFGALRDLHGGNRYRRPWPKQGNSI